MTPSRIIRTGTTSCTMIEWARVEPRATVDHGLLTVRLVPSRTATVGGVAAHETSPEAALLHWLFASAAGAEATPPTWRGASTRALAGRLTHHRGWTLLARRADRVPGLPEDLAVQAGARARHAAAKQLATSADLASCARALEGAGIAWACVKGPVLAAAYARTGEQRAYGDLDLLVPPDAFEAALAALGNAGGGLVDRNWALMRSVVPGEVTVRAPQGTVVDLHWSLVSRAHRRARLAVPTAPLLRRARRTELLGSAVPVLTPAEALAHLCLHACASGAHRWGWLLDVTLTARGPGLTWPAVVAVAQAWRVAVPVGLVLARCQRHLGLAVPPDVLRALVGRGWALAEALASRASDPLGPGDPYWAREVAVGAVDHDTPHALLRTKASHALGSRRRGGFVQRPDDLGSALHPAGTREDLGAYLRTVAAQQ